MSRWEASLHPSWDRMYLSGMTVREIADYTGRARSTVHRHLQVRESYSGDFREVHAAANCARGADWPSTSWRRRYKELQDFYTREGGLPRSQGERAESALALWVSRQLRLHTKGELTAVKVTLMDTIPGWDVPPRQIALDQHWRERLTQLQDFIDTSGHLPRYKRHSSESERILGVWLHIQHQARAECTLLPWRKVALDDGVPGWRSTM